MEKTLPKGWELKKLGEVCLINPPKPEIPSENNVTFLPMDAISADGDIQHMETRQYKEVKNGYTGFVENDVLFAKITPCMENGKGTIAKGLLNSIGFGSTEFHVIRASEKILPEIIFRYLSLKNIRKIAEVNMVGSAGQKRVPQSFLNTLKIPLPPLPTQHKIVEILEEADNLRKLRQKADEKMKDLIPSLFVEMFGDPATNPKGWEVKKLGELCDKKTGTRNPSEDADGSFEYVDISSIDNIQGIIKASQTIANKDAPSRARKIIMTNDVLVSTVRPNLNAVAIVPNYLDNQICSTGFCVLRISPTVSSHRYIYAYTRSKHFAESLAKKTQGANYPAVSDKDIFNFPIPLPPLPLQQEFAERVKEIEAEKERQAEGRKKLDELFNSLMQRAFKGELVA